MHIGWDMIKKLCTILIFSACACLFAQVPKARQFYESGLRKQQRYDLYGAAEDFQEALQINPSYGDAWFHLAQVSYELDDYNLTQSYLDNAEKYSRDNMEILSLRGQVCISQGRLDDARAIFEAMLKKYPNNVQARFGLAELNLYAGSYDGARNLYNDALKRQDNNRKALLSLAIISADEGHYDVAENYLLQALRYHSGDPQVHYLAGYLSARAGKLDEAERRARAAVQINGDYTKAYVLLASVLYGQGRYDEVIDICDYLIARNRNTSVAWYLKGLAQKNQGNVETAISTWTMALTIAPQDEVMRSALELLVTKTTQVEDARRSQWAAYHIKKGRDFAKLFMGEEARYEYQRALKIDPNNANARAEFAELLSNAGLSELYLQQLKFLNQKAPAVDSKNEDEDARYRRLKMSDTIEAYDSLMRNSLNSKWDVEPFYLDKTRWHVGLYYVNSPVQLIHTELEQISADMIQDVFTGVSVTSVDVQQRPVKGYGEGYRLARTGGMDYFILMTVEESDREVSMDAVLYSARTGVELTRFSTFRTGNDKYASVLRSFRRNLLNLLPVRGKIISRSVNEVLVDLGKVEGLVPNTVLDVIKAGAIKTKDNGLGIEFGKNDLLGKITVSHVGEEISQGKLNQDGFYDRVNVNDDVLVFSMPDENGNSVADTAPAADENGEPARKKDRKKADEKTTAEQLGLVRTPPIVDLIRSIE